jgi:hypothetical protein
MASWLTNIAQTVEREYERRIRRASLVTAYGVDHHGQADHVAHHAAEDSDVQIANVPRGTEVYASADASEPAAPAAGAEIPREQLTLEPLPQPEAAHDTAAGDSDEGEIVNTPPGTPTP